MSVVQNITPKLLHICHNLFFFSTVQMLDTLLTTLIREMQNIAVPKRKQEALLVARRFMRSVVRIYVVRSVETSSEVGRASRSRYRKFL